MERTLDRLPSHDLGNFNFLMTAVRPTLRTPRGYTWQCGTQLDQGSEGACVGFGWSHELAARPSIVTGLNNSIASALYHEFQRNDEWEGEDYEGTSVGAGAKVIKARGFMSEYRWETTLAGMVDVIGYDGPVVIGVNWYEGMFDTDEAGFVHVTGDIAGGHCVLVRGVSVKRQEFLIRNSWGPNWGLYGECRISWADMDRLIDEHGDICVPRGRDKVGSLPT